MSSTKSSETQKHSSMELYLRREGIGDSAVCIPIATKKIKIGCDERRSSVVVQGKKISRTHCEIRFKSGSVYVTDCRSRNGTFVNNKRVKHEQKLRIGDLIGLGTNPLPPRSYDENQFVYTLCRSSPQKVILDEINVELFNFGTAEPDFGGINIDDILKSLEDDSNLSKEAIDMEVKVEDRIPIALYQEEVKKEQNDQNNAKCEQECEANLKHEQVEGLSCSSGSSGSTTAREFELNKRIRAALWDEVDLSTETYQPHLKQLSVRIVKVTDVIRFLNSMKKSHTGKRKIKESLVTGPKKHSKVVKKLIETKDISKLIKKSPKVVKKLSDKLPQNLKTSTSTSQNSTFMAEASTSPRNPRTKHKHLLDNVKGSPHPRKIKAANDTVLFGATATVSDQKQSLVTDSPRMKSTRSDPSPVKNYRVISEKPVKPLKSILVKSERNKKNFRKKNIKVTFCTSVYIKEYIQEDDFDSEP